MNKPGFILILGTLVIGLLLSGCFRLFDTGTNTVLLVVYNPHKTKQAILFLKDGNATTGNSLQVSIKNINNNLEQTEVGNTLTTDSNHGKVALSTNAINLIWLNDNNIVIKYDKRLRTFIQEHSVYGVDVAYKPQ